jgi:hypothetical protein
MGTQVRPIDPTSLHTWLSREVPACNAAGTYASTWFHGDGKGGFGVVLVDIGSGELHVMPNGLVTRHVERDGVVTVSDQFTAHSQKEFQALYEEFKRKICE